MASWAYGTPQPQMDAGLKQWEDKNRSNMPQPKPASSPMQMSLYSPSPTFAYAPGAAQPKPTQSFGTPYGQQPSPQPRPSWGGGSANPVYTLPAQQPAPQMPNEQMDRIRQDAEAYNARLRKQAEEDAKQQQEYIQRQQDDRLARADWLTERERTAKTQSEERARQYWRDKEANQARLLEEARRRPPRQPASQPTSQPAPDPAPPMTDYEKRNKAIADVVARDEQDRKTNPAGILPNDPPWMVQLKQREYQERLARPRRNLEDELYAPGGWNFEAANRHLFTNSGSGVGPATPPQTGGPMYPQPAGPWEILLPPGGPGMPAPPQTGGPMYPQPRPVNEAGYDPYGHGNFANVRNGGSQPVPQTSFYREPVQSFGGTQFPPAGFYPSYGSPFGGQFGQPQTGQIDAFIQRLNDTMTPYHTGVLTGQPQFNMNQLWGQAGNMVQNGWQNPFAPPMYR